MADNLLVAARGGSQHIVAATDTGNGVLRLATTTRAATHSIGFVQPNGEVALIGTVRDANGVHTICTK